MNSEIRKLGIIAFAAALPLTALAESNSSSSASTSPSSTSPTSPSSSSATTPTYSSPSSSNSTSSTSRMDRSSENSIDSSSSMSSTMPSVTGDTLGNIQRLSEQAVDRQFTAKDLIGKEVYDSRDKRIGEIKDVVLDAMGAQQLASAIRTHQSQTGNYGSATVSGSSSTPASTSASKDHDRSTTSGVGTASAGAGATSVASTPDFASMASEPAAIISYGGFLGVGNNLLRVPLSQLRYDSNNQHLTVNVQESQLSSLKDTTDTSRSAAE